MDAFWKCLLACVMSLVPTGVNTVSQHFSSETSTKDYFVKNRESYQDVILNILIEDNPPALLRRDSLDKQVRNQPDYPHINREMRELGIESISVMGPTIVLGLDQHDSQSRYALIWQPYAFADKIAEPKTLSRIDDDWALSSKPTDSCSPPVVQLRTGT